MTAPAVPRRAIVMLVALTFVWGTNWPLFPHAVREISVWTFRSVSMVSAGIVLLAIAQLRGQPMALPRRYWRTVVLGTLLYLVLWNLCSTYAAVLIPSGQAAVLGFTEDSSVLAESVNSRRPCWANACARGWCWRSRWAQRA